MAKNIIDNISQTAKKKKNFSAKRRRGDSNISKLLKFIVILIDICCASWTSMYRFIILQPYLQTFTNIRCSESTSTKIRYTHSDLCANRRALCDNQQIKLRNFIWSYLERFLNMHKEIISRNVCAFVRRSFINDVSDKNHFCVIKGLFQVSW